MTFHGSGEDLILIKNITLECVERNWDWQNFMGVKKVGVALFCVSKDMWTKISKNLNRKYHSK